MGMMLLFGSQKNKTIGLKAQNRQYQNNIKRISLLGFYKWYKSDNIIPIVENDMSIRFITNGIKIKII